MFDTILFDLDGTIADSGMGVTNAVMYALKKYGIQVADRSELYSFIGPPLRESFMKKLNCSPEEAERAVVYYREYYADKGVLEDEIYPGIPELLQKLHESGKKVLLATSKPEVYAKKILEHFKLSQYFDVIAGATLDGSRDSKASVIRYCLGLYKGDLGEAVILGDRMHDVCGAKETGIKSIGCLWGYGSREELEAYGADYIIESPEEAVEIIFD